ncbi:MAG: dTDP-4-dehydrorhamnose 3,5-epimerase [Bryobacteraceae bacterium]|nr:dTDP-4-dehydrorhamnose 3,5-epimerase [Bryobacteraceae bacterium]
MRFIPMEVDGAWIIEPERLEDERGWFARAFCSAEFEARGLETRWVQANMSLSRSAYTLRGLHYQMPPHEEAKLVRCLRGRLWDVVADLRPGSPTFGRWAAAELTPANLRWVYIPKGCAHGFLTLEENSEAFYLVSCAYAPQAEAGVRWDDPLFSIRWPAEPRVLSAKDLSWPRFQSA